MEGKILITKTFGISQLIYSLQTTSIRNEDVKRVENIIYKFIWNIPNNCNRVNGKISRQKLQAKKEQGGMNAPNIEYINKALKYKFLLRQINNKHPVNYMTKDILNKEGISIDDLNIRKTTDSKYLNTCIKVHNKLYTLLRKT